VSVDYHLSVTDTEEVCKGTTFVAIVSFGLGNAFARVFQDAGAFRYVFQRETTGSMNVGGADNQARQVKISLWFALQYTVPARRSNAVLRCAISGFH
jgi:hypothetical protein